MKTGILNKNSYKVSSNKLILILYILITIIIAVVFFYSNNIAVKLFKESNEQLLYEVEDVPYIGGNMTYSYEGFKYDELKLKNNVDMTFWSYVDSRGDNVNRKAIIYFKSSEKTYACDAVLTRRVDVYRLNRDYVKGTNESYGFTVNFSPLIMKDGEYQLGIYTEENIDEKAFVLTPYTFIKEGNSFLEIKHNSIQNNGKFKGLETGEDVNAKIKTISTTKFKDYLYIDGYAFKKNYDTKDNDIFIELMNSKGESIIVDAVKMNANNLGIAYEHHKNVLPEEYGSEKYLNSGFAAKIPLTMLNEETYNINIIMRIGGQLVLKKTNEKYVHRVDVNNRVDGMEIDTDNNVNYYIESIDAKTDMINVSGWILQDNLSTADQDVYIHFKNEQGSIQTFKASSIIREGIAKWKGDKYLTSGFLLRIPTKYMDEGKYTVFASVKNGDELHTASKPFIEEEVIYLNRINIGQRMSDLNINKSDKVQYYIETLNNIADKISVTGWIVKDGTPSVNHNIYIKFENENKSVFVYKAAIIKRNDIAAWRGTEYLYSGFYVDIPVSSLPEGNYQVTALIETGKEVEEAVKPYIEKVKKYKK